MRLRHRATPQQRAFRSKWERLKAVTFRAGRGRERHARAAAPAPAAPDGLRGAGVGLLRRRHLARGAGLPQDQQHVAHRLRQPRGLRQAVPQQGRLQAEVPARRAPRGVRLVAPGARADGSQRPAGERLPLLLGHARPRPRCSASSASTASSRAPTRKGMVHSNYFIGGYAIHGYVSVPAYPASHGCLRVPIPDAACDRRPDLARRDDLRLPLSRGRAQLVASRQSCTSRWGLRQGVGEQQAAEAEEQQRERRRRRCAATHASRLDSTMPAKGDEEDVVGVVDQLARTRVRPLAQALHAGLRERVVDQPWACARILLPLSASTWFSRALAAAGRRRTARSWRAPAAPPSRRRSGPPWPWP